MFSVFKNVGEGNIGLDEEWTPAAKERYLQFIEACRRGPADFGLTPRAEPTAYARCFAVFGLHLLQKRDILDAMRPKLIRALRDGLRSKRKQYNDVPNNKAYSQLLTFTLSALAILNALRDDPLDDLVIEQLPLDVEKELTRVGALDGRAQSGNQAMFMAIYLLHARDWLGLDVGEKLCHWTRLHYAAMNRFGFWGSGSGIQHLQFQNGYHQYEIFEYLRQGSPRISDAVKAVRSLADTEGHFAPYPGGGGCYDYDAVFVLTPNGQLPDYATENLLRRTEVALIGEQTTEGGWCESRYIRPRSLGSLVRYASHVARALPNRHLFYERFRYGLTLQRPKYNRIHTHWSHYSRRWDEADLWDSWFRLLAVARIQVACEPKRAEDWGFINYPGIGYHPSLAE